MWDVSALFKEILTGLKKAKTLNKIPDVIGIDTWAVDYALLDENDKLIDCVYAYRDKRTEKSIPEVHKLLPHEELYKLCGKDLDETFGLVETVEKAAQIYMLTFDKPRLNTIKDEELVEIAKFFGVKYKKEFLG